MGDIRLPIRGIKNDRPPLASKGGPVSSPCFPLGNRLPYTKNPSSPTGTIITKLAAISKDLWLGGVGHKKCPRFGGGEPRAKAMQNLEGLLGVKM